MKTSSQRTYAISNHCFKQYCICQYSHLQDVGIFVGMYLSRGEGLGLKYEGWNINDRVELECQNKRINTMYQSSTKDCSRWMVIR